jgi:hypothetical protein
MVSNKTEQLSIPESLHKSRSAERLTMRDDVIWSDFVRMRCDWNLPMNGSPERALLKPETKQSGSVVALTNDGAVECGSGRLVECVTV